MPRDNEGRRSWRSIDHVEGCSRPFLPIAILFQAADTVEVQGMESISIVLLIGRQVFCRIRLHPHASSLADSDDDHSP
jgi:hypothetical protein